MTSTTSVIVQAGAGGLPLLRTADSIVHQRRRPADVWLVEAAPHGSTPLAESVAARLRASLVPAGAKPGVSMNRAVRGTASELMGACLSGPTATLNGFACPRSSDVNGIAIDRCGRLLAIWPAQSGEAKGTYVSQQTRGPRLRSRAC